MGRRDGVKGSAWLTPLGRIANAVCARALDFVSADACLLCGREPSPEFPPEDPCRAKLVGPVRVRYFGPFHVTNHPICTRCAGRFERCAHAGRLRAGTDWPRPVGTEPPTIPVYAPFMTNEPVLGVIHRFKFSQYRELSGMLGGAIAAGLPTVAGRADVIVPVPMSAGDLRRRGYNPAGRLAEAVSEALKLPLEADSLLKVRRTARQSLTPHEARHDNVRGAFSATDVVCGLRVLLVDDLVTTGATAGAAAGALARRGARSVAVVCFARAL
jgi:ComF family protein